jgi:hypothetical protein
MDKNPPSTKWKQIWVLAAWALCLVVTCSATADSLINLSKDQALRIGRRIWQNECGGSVSGLTSWNEGEDFASLGIGHFIWYPAGIHGPFEESFPRLLQFIAASGTRLPPWLQPSTVCPWNSRTEFFGALNSHQMIELREFLVRTVAFQAEFMVTRLHDSLPKMLDEAAPADRARIRQQFTRLASTPGGCYALVDYVNFKGEGTLPSERYRDHGWGLLQVLEEMRESGEGPGAVDEFARAAAAVLKRRVQNSPPARHEARWLSGWINRVNSYRQNS